MICPVCKHESIPSLAIACPSCSSSLVGFRLLDTLEEQYVEIVKNKVEREGRQVQQIKDLEHQLARKKKRNILLWLLLFSLPLLYYFCAPKEPQKTAIPIIERKDSLELYKTMITEHEIEIKALNRQLKAIEGTMNVRELKYEVKEGDLLYDLGLLFYNDTSAWYQIALDNKIYDVRGLPKGDTISIKYRD